ncbi:MAG: hypothetical protein OXI73_15895 [Rhodospirillales bacterium]|nr:hypothetical protein [Rhodospirillales bacterium]
MPTASTNSTVATCGHLTARRGGGPADTLQGTVEPYLIQQGFIERTAQGRITNDVAWAREPDRDGIAEHVH